MWAVLRSCDHDSYDLTARTGIVDIQAVRRDRSIFKSAEVVVKKNYSVGRVYLRDTFIARVCNTGKGQCALCQERRGSCKLVASRAAVEPQRTRLCRAQVT